MTGSPGISTRFPIIPARAGHCGVDIIIMGGALFVNDIRPGSIALSHIVVAVQGMRALLDGFDALIMAEARGGA